MKPFLYIAILFSCLVRTALATTAPLDPLEPVNGASVPEQRQGMVLKWQREPTAMWYEVYIKRDGVLYERKWVFGTYKWGAVEYVEYDFVLASVAAGKASSLIEWWVRPWEPVGGAGAWSSMASFTLTRVNLPALTAGTPPNGDILVDAWWNSLTAHDLNSEATWFEFEVKDTSSGLVLRKKWFERVEGFNYASTYYSSKGEWWGDPEFALLPNGTYSWRVRQWSPAFGNSPWSAENSFTVQKIDFSRVPVPPDAGSISISNDDWLSGIANSGNSPEFYYMVVGKDNQAATWYRLWIGDAAGKKLYDKWFRYVEANTAQGHCEWDPKTVFNLGSLKAYIQPYNPSGIGAWSSAISYIVPQNTPGSVFDLNVTYGPSMRGIASIGWKTNAGVGWFQVYVTSDDKLIYNKWVKSEDVDPNAADFVRKLSYDSLTNTGSVQLVTSAPIYTGGTLDVWVRSYGNTGEYTAWKSSLNYSNPNVTLYTKPTGLTGVVNASSVLMDWDLSSIHGFYELVVWRNGTKYFSTRVEGDTSLTPSPTYYETHWMPVSGNYQFWVRAGVGDKFSPWSDPGTFVVP